MREILPRTLLSSMALVIAIDAAACVCLFSDPKTAFKQSHVVFLGEVIADGDVTRMRVLETFKGTDAETIDVSTLRMTSCAYAGETAPGSRHLIYGWRDENGQLSASACSRSAPEARAACDLRYLRSRAWWWRSPLSSFRVLRLLRIRRNPCAPAS